MPIRVPFSDIRGTGVLDRNFGQAEVLPYLTSALMGTTTAFTTLSTDWVSQVQTTVGVIGGAKLFVWGSGTVRSQGTERVSLRLHITYPNGTTMGLDDPPLLNMQVLTTTLSSASLTMGRFWMPVTNTGRHVLALEAKASKPNFQGIKPEDTHIYAVVV